MRRSSDRRTADSELQDDDRLAALRLVDVSRETEQRLATYVELLRRWQSVKNLVGASTLAQVWTRHIADSAQLVPLAPGARRWIDLGSGAGFPGIVIAILLGDLPDTVVHLVESNSRKCAFLREVIRAVGCPARVHDARAEAVVGTLGDVDVVTSRALAPLPALLEMGKIPLSRGALGLFLKSVDEIEALQLGSGAGEWRVVPSVTSPEGRIVLIRTTTTMGASERKHRGESAS